MDFIKDLTIDNLRNAAEDAFNQAKPKSDLEARVYDVLSHKNWGSSSTMMNQIAGDTYDFDKYPVVAKLMWESMENQRPAAWRVVFKGLTLLEHLVKNGGERCVDDARNHSHILRSLHQFNYYEGTIDRGLGVREKSKQIVELLGDDERIREERQKAKKLREKFGGSLGGVSGGGGGGGNSGGSGYSGYGNNGGGWDGSSGYGNSGIGSSGGGFRAGGASGGGSGDSTSYGNSGGFSGRYAEDSQNRAGSSNTPTFATIPDDKPKDKTKVKVVKKKKKKKQAQQKQEEQQGAAEPVVDLFSFDVPAPPPTEPDTKAAADVEFDAFAANASGSGGGANNDFDAFGSFNTGTAIHSQNVSQKNTQFDAFAHVSQPATNSTALPTNNIMGGTTNMVQVNHMFGQMNTQGETMVKTGQFNLSNPIDSMRGMQPQANATGVMGGMQSQSITANVMGGMRSPNIVVAAPVTGDDDFGDFEDAAPKKSETKSNDPLSNLISLDSLEKNRKRESTLGQPIVANAAAAHFIQNQTLGNYSSPNPNISFQGIDGLTAGNTGGSFTGGNALQTGQPIMGSGTAGGADVIAMMSPQVLLNPQQQMNSLPQQGMSQNGMQQGMGMMNPQMMQQAMQGNMVQGSMVQGSVMQGNMMQGSGMMNPQMMQQQNNMMMQGGVMQGNMMSVQNPVRNIQQGMNTMQPGMNTMQPGMNTMQPGMNTMQPGMNTTQQGMNTTQQGMGGNIAGGGQMGGQTMHSWR